MILDECFALYNETDRIKRKNESGSYPVGFLKSFVNSLAPKNIHGIRYFIHCARMSCDIKEFWDKYYSEIYDKFKSWEEMRPFISDPHRLYFLDDFHADDWELKPSDNV